jgi:hypothetical protein
VIAFKGIRMLARLKYQRRTRWGFVEVWLLQDVEGAQTSNPSMMLEAAAIDAANERRLTP